MTNLDIGFLGRGLALLFRVTEQWLGVPKLSRIFIEIAFEICCVSPLQNFHSNGDCYFHTFFVF